LYFALVVETLYKRGTLEGSCNFLPVCYSLEASISLTHSVHLVNLLMYYKPIAQATRAAAVAALV